MLSNYTGKKIVINTSRGSIRDHSDIQNFMPTANSVILRDGQCAEFALFANSNMYIITEDCSHSGHFAFNMLTGLPQNPIIYVGLNDGGSVAFSQPDLLSSDIDFGLARLMDRSQVWIMFMNPYFIILITIVIAIIVSSILAIIVIKKFDFLAK